MNKLPFEQDINAELRKVTAELRALREDFRADARYASMGRRKREGVTDERTHRGVTEEG